MPDEWVLVRYGPIKPMYNVITVNDWDKWQRRHAHKNIDPSWGEAARGTHDEMVALAKLMPEPKSLSFD